MEAKEDMHKFLDTLSDEEIAILNYEEDELLDIFIEYGEQGILDLIDMDKRWKELSR